MASISAACARTASSNAGPKWLSSIASNRGAPHGRGLGASRGLFPIPDRRSPVPGADSAIEPVVWRFLGDLDVVDVALAYACGCDADEASLALELGNRRAAAIAHAGAQASHQLMDHRGNASLVRDAPLDSLGHELVRSASALHVEFVLEVAVAAAAAHRADRAHSPIFLVRAPLEEDQFTRTLIGAREEIANHGAAGADCERLHDVPRVA